MEEGSRPAVPAAAATRARTWDSRSEMEDVAFSLWPLASGPYFFSIPWSAGRDAFTSAAFAPFGSIFR
jgi:hypothetical protein